MRIDTDEEADVGHQRDEREDEKGVFEQTADRGLLMSRICLRMLPGQSTPVSQLLVKVRQTELVKQLRSRTASNQGAPALQCLRGRPGSNDNPGAPAARCLLGRE